MILLELMERGGLARIANANPANSCPDLARLAKLALAGSPTFDAGSDPTLHGAIEAACVGLEISPAEVHEALALEDIADWHAGNLNAATLAGFAQSLQQRQKMRHGELPGHYTQRATCEQCGPIWLWFAGNVNGCPWCWNRKAGLSVPRP